MLNKFYYEYNIARIKGTTPRGKIRQRNSVLLMIVVTFLRVDYFADGEKIGIRIRINFSSMRLK